MGTLNGRLTARTATRLFIPIPVPNLRQGTYEVLFDSVHSRALFATVTSVISDGRMCRSTLHIGSGGSEASTPMAGGRSPVTRVPIAWGGGTLGEMVSVPATVNDDHP